VNELIFATVPIAIGTQIDIRESIKSANLWQFVFCI